MKLRPEYLIWRASPMVLVVAVLAAAASCYLLVTRGLRQDYSVESLVARNDETYVRYRQFLKEFVSNEMAIIAVRGDAPLLPDVVELLHELCVRCRGLPGVQEVSAVSEVPDLGGVGRDSPPAARAAALAAAVLSPTPIVDALRRDPQRRGELLEQLLAEPLIADNLISRDGRTTAVICQMLSTSSPTDSKQAVTRLRRIVADAQRAHPELTIILAGPAVTMIDMFDYIHKDLVLFSFVVFGLMSASLGLIFRRLRLVVVALGAAAAATTTTLGLSIVLGIAMSLVTQMIVILGSILAVANAVHLVVAWQEQHARRPAGRRSWDRLLTLRRMLAPTAAASLTTAVGFGALAISDLVPFKDFARLMSFAILAGWLVGVAATRLLGASAAGSAPPAVAAIGPLGRLLRRIARLAQRRGKTIVAAFAVVFIAGAAGVFRLRFESDFLKNFRAASGVRRAYSFIEQNLAPVGSVEVVVRRKDGETMLTGDNLAKARELGADVVAAFEPIRKAMSLADLLTAGGTPLPESPLAIRLRMRLAKAMFGGDVLRNFVNDRRDAMRINLRAVEGIQVAEKLEMARRISARAAGSFGDGYEVEVTGLYPFYATLVAGLLRDQNRSFAVAVVCIFGLMALFLRSIRLSLIALVPNVVPIGLTMGLMGWRGIPVNMATAMILAVSIGIAVDDALHYAWRFRRELRRRGDPSAAMLAAHATVGRACVFTSMVIVSGFWILCLSEFLPTAYFGGLIGVTMLGALLADLLLFPMLLVWASGRRGPAAGG